MAHVNRAPGTPAAVTQTDLEALRWYETRSNNGRGKLTAESSRLVCAGLLTQTWTSVNCWVLTLSAKGKQVLA